MKITIRCPKCKQLVDVKQSQIVHCPFCNKVLKVYEYEKVYQRDNTIRNFR